MAETCGSLGILLETVCRVWWLLAQLCQCLPWCLQIMAHHHHHHHHNSCLHDQQVLSGTKHKSDLFIWFLSSTTIKLLMIRLEQCSCWDSDVQCNALIDKDSDNSYVDICISELFLRSVRNSIEIQLFDDRTKSWLNHKQEKIALWQRKYFDML